MDFNSLGASAPFYILHKGKFSLQVGTVKSKTEPKAQYTPTTPAVFTGLAQVPQVVDVVVSVNGAEIPFNNLPINTETAQYNNGETIVSCSREAMLKAVDGIMQNSKKALEDVPYHNTVLSEGEKMLEILNPTYAENKRNARTIQDLQDRVDSQDKKLDQILSYMEAMNGSTHSKTAKS